MRAFYINIRNVNEEKYLFDSLFKVVIVRVFPFPIAHNFSLETPKKSIIFVCIIILVSLLTSDNTNSLQQNCGLVGFLEEEKKKLNRHDRFYV